MFVQYAVPLAPAVPAIGFAIWFWPDRSADLDKEGRQREMQRPQLIGLAGFAFAGLLALAVIDGRLQGTFVIPIYYLLLSFLLYFTCLNLTNYWAVKTWHLLVTSTLMDTGALCLLLCATFIIRSAHPGMYGNAITIVAVCVWFFDFGMNLLTLRRGIMDWREEQEQALVEAPGLVILESDLEGDTE
jgi:hypothetical protein